MGVVTVAEMFGRPLLRLDANDGRYFIARHLQTGELSFVHAPREGGFGWSRLFNGSGGSSDPFEEWVMAGRLPPAARDVQIKLDVDGVVRTKARPGFWMAAVPWGGREAEGEVLFVNREGDVVARLDFFLERKKIRRPAA